MSGERDRCLFFAFARALTNKPDLKIVEPLLVRASELVLGLVDEIKRRGDFTHP
jgi:hypothetical protein